MIFVRFERENGEYDSDAASYGPLDWVECDGDVLHAEANDGKVRHEYFAQMVDGLWSVPNGKSYSYYVVASCPAHFCSGMIHLEHNP
jgi:hypothetical protein